MSSNVGLSTPRGSGTSGYVQRNLSHLKPRDRPAPYSIDEATSAKHRQRRPDPEMLEHERRRRIEVKVFELRDRLEEEGVDEDEIDEQIDVYREKLQAEDQGRGLKASEVKGLKAHQVHDLAKAKIEETEKVRKAFGISKDYEEGSHWRRQEEKKLREAGAAAAAAAAAEAEKEEENNHDHDNDQD